MREPEIDIHGRDLSGLIAAARPDDVPPTTEPPKVATSVRLSLAVVERLREIAQTRGIGYTQLVERYVLAGLAAEPGAEQILVPLSEVQAELAQLAAGHRPAA